MSDEQAAEPGAPSRSGRDRLSLVLLVVLAGVGLAWLLRGPSIAQIMVEGHKGSRSTVQRVLDGNGTDADHLQLLAWYERMSTLTPPKGDAESWRQKTTALVDAAQQLVDGHTNDGLDALDVAVDCKACHAAHR